MSKSFDSGQITIGYWNSATNYMYGRITGTTTRNGTTITLSGMKIAITSKYSSTGSDTIWIKVNGTQTNISISLGNRGTTNFGTHNLNNTSFTSSIGNTSASVSWSSSDGKNGSFDVPFDAGYGAPTGTTGSVTSTTYQTVDVSGSVSGWGTNASSGSIIVAVGRTTGTQPSTSSFGNWARRQIYVVSSSSTKSGTGTINNSSTTQGEATFNLVGCTPFKLGVYSVNNGSIEARYIDSTVRYTNPKIAGISKSSETLDADGSNVVMTIRGGSGTSDNTENSATTYQIKYVYGTTDSGWVDVATDQSPNTNQTYTISHIPYNTSVTVYGRMVYQGKNSSEVSTTFTTSSDPYHILPAPTLAIASSTGTNLVVNYTIPTLSSEYDNIQVNLLLTTPEGTTTIQNVRSGGSGTTTIQVARGSSGTLDGVLVAPSVHRTGSETHVNYQMTSMYGSVNGKAKSVVKWYVSVNRKSKKVLKWYGSVNGKSKRIY